MTKDGKTAVIQQNIYNGEGQRIQKVDGDETINYYYQDGVVAYTTDTEWKPEFTESDRNRWKCPRNRKISTECNTILSVQQRYPGKYKQSGKRRWKC